MPSSSKPVDRIISIFSLKKILPGFLRVAQEQNTGEGVTKAATEFIRESESLYSSLKVTISFGKGRATAVPWIAFTGYNQTLQEGIYPVYLYYKNHNRLILAYGVSDTNSPQKLWPNNGRLKTIEAYFKRRKEAPPERYGSSFVFAVYNTTLPLFFSKMEKDLNQLVDEFHALFTAKGLVHEPDNIYSVRKKFTQLGIDQLNDTRANIQYETYSIDQALQELFIGEKSLSGILSILSNKKNIILQGPPGTGKTFLAKRLAFLQIGKKDISRIQVIQFHQSYGYEDFIQGYRPNDRGGFELKNGVFYNFCLKAQQDPKNTYFFIIDEINRGNLSKIFGEAMMLIENDKRGSEFGIRLANANETDEKFYIPANLYLIGTMNTADRSLAMVDYALRRRFAFVTVAPEFGASFIQYLVGKGAPENLARKISNNMMAINQFIVADRNLGAGFTIGHSYFCGSSEAYDEAWYNSIIEYEIKHLLDEYWFDSEETASERVKNLLR